MLPVTSNVNYRFCVHVKFHVMCNLISLIALIHENILSRAFTEISPTKIPVIRYNEKFSLMQRGIQTCVVTWCVGDDKHGHHNTLGTIPNAVYPAIGILCPDLGSLLAPGTTVLFRFQVSRNHSLNRL